jgi:hypothetical protein
LGQAALNARPAPRRVRDERARLRTALDTAELAEGDAENHATHITAVNQSLAVMSRAWASRQQLRTIVDISMSALSQALHSRSWFLRDPSRRCGGRSKGMADMGTSGERCVNCREIRAGRRFAFHVGVFAGASTQGRFGSVEVTTRYRVLGVRDGFLCGRCQARQLAVRYVAPLLLAAAGSFVVAYGWPFGGGASPVVLQILAGLVAIVMATVGRGTWDAVHTALTARDIPAGCLGAIGYVAGLVVWGLATYGTVFPFASAESLEPDQHSLRQGTDLLSAPPAWVTGVFGFCQLLLLATVLAVRTPVLESLVWRRTKKALRAELGYERLHGFNGSRYSRLRKPAPEPKPPSPSHR